MVKENMLYLLCMSNGDADGLGKEREKELEKSCTNLKFAEPPTIIDDADLRDGMDVDWPPGIICNHLKKYL